MRKGEQTRQEIIRKAAPIFNQKGYEGAALSDLMRATGLEKGGIYRHLESKEELAGDTPINRCCTLAALFVAQVSHSTPDFGRHYLRGELPYLLDRLLSAPPTMFHPDDQHLVYLPQPTKGFASLFSVATDSVFHTQIFSVSGCS